MTTHQLTTEQTGTGPDAADVSRAVRAALDEDLRHGPDVTTEATVPTGARSVGRLTPRRDGILAGLPVAAVVLAEVLGRGAAELRPAASDGDRVRTGVPVAEIEAPTRGLLTAERTLLNFVGHLSGVATVTAAWVDAVAGTGCAVRDTRKTLPGLRSLEKYAVRCGGGVNHRLGLGDAVLVKDNHVAAAGSITAAVEAVRTRAPDLWYEVEVDTLAQLDETLALDVELVLLDNFTVADCVEAVRRAAGTGTRLEVSGGLTLDRARAYAETGVDYLAVGALTHSAPALDLGLDL
ncbi:MAG: carboxylating nicotinate-nucleotide diphosphorylase [Streptosporangiales bacterium]|nr:carboxylating nicotinate-nucleotide diphosphorylase [Streptosporangiales bacterium]